SSAHQVSGPGGPRRPLRRRRLLASHADRREQDRERVRDVAEGRLRRGARRLGVRGQRQHERPPSHRGSGMALLRRLQMSPLETTMKMIRYGLIVAGVVLGSLLIVTSASAHKDKHTPQQLKAFEEVFMEQVRIGDLLFHGDDGAQKKLNVKMTRTGTACAMCHPFATDTHPYEVPKFQEQV